jgi:hypothetical protein
MSFSPDFERCICKLLAGKIINRSKNSMPDLTILSRKSWVSYTRLLAKYLAVECASSIVLGLAHFRPAWQVFTVLLNLSLLCKVFSLLSCQLYYDRQGIWFHSGLFPWDKGIVGVDWRDLECCLVTIGFRSWLSRSSQIVVNHRFADRRQLVLNDMSNGRNTCITINTLHQDFVRSRSRS